MSGVYRFAGAGVQPGGGPRLVAAARTQSREQTPVTPPAGTKTPADPANSRKTETDAAVKRSPTHSLDEEDPAVPAHTVRPVFR